MIVLKLIRVGSKIRHQVDLDLQNSTKDTVLHLSIANQVPDIAMALIEKGANPDLPNADGEKPAEVNTTFWATQDLQAVVEARVRFAAKVR